jgi:hypothetical protein
LPRITAGLFGLRTRALKKKIETALQTCSTARCKKLSKIPQAISTAPLTLLEGDFSAAAECLRNAFSMLSEKTPCS